MALATAWFLPPRALVTAWFGPDGAIEALRAPGNDPAAIPAVIGPRGPAGPAGNAAQRYEHVQASAEQVWTINHNLGLEPKVSVYSPGGVEVEAAVLHASTNQTIVSFAVPYAGRAILS